MITACRRGKNLKYAANLKHVEHTGMRQRFYLRLLCAKRAVCSKVPGFVAYFRQVIPEVRGKTEIRRPDPYYELLRPAVLLQKIRLCSAVFDFSPHFRKYAVKASVQKRRHDNLPSENSPLNAKTAFRRLPRTKPDVPSQGPFKASTLR